VSRIIFGKMTKVKNADGIFWKIQEHPNQLMKFFLWMK